MTPHAHLGYFLKDHMDHWEAVIAPALAAGKPVVSDRYLTSHIVYQSHDLYLNDLGAYECGFRVYPPSLDAHLTRLRELYPVAQKSDLDIFIDVEPMIATNRCALKRELLAPQKANELAWLYRREYVFRETQASNTNSKRLSASEVLTNTRAPRGTVVVINGNLDLEKVANRVEEAIRKCLSQSTQNLGAPAAKPSRTALETPA
jgi:thymidylate kinase